MKCKPENKNVLCLGPDLLTFLWWVIGSFLSITVPDSFYLLISVRINETK